MQDPAFFSRCPMCQQMSMTMVAHYDHVSPGEKAMPGDLPYDRQLLQCMVCGHFINCYPYHFQKMYQSFYGDAVYGTDEGIARAYDRVMGLPQEQSDNAGRTVRVYAYLEQKGVYPSALLSPKLLDVGSGICVFPARMKEYGWDCVALDPDPRNVRHAQERVGVTGYCSDFLAASGTGQFHLVTMNKVIEHIGDPVAFVAKSREFLLSGGTLYVEVPSGERAIKFGGNRQEFFWEHHSAYSMCSLVLLAKKAGFVIETMGYVHEPSGKHTLFAFLQVEAVERKS